MKRVYFRVAVPRESIRESDKNGEHFHAALEEAAGLELLRDLRSEQKEAISMLVHVTRGDFSKSLIFQLLVRVNEICRVVVFCSPLKSVQLCTIDQRFWDQNNDI